MGRGVCDRIALNNLHSVASFFADTHKQTHTHTHKDTYSHVIVVVRGRCCSPLQGEATKNICTHARVCMCITHVHMPTRMRVCAKWPLSGCTSNDTATPISELYIFIHSLWVSGVATPNALSEPDQAKTTHVTHLKCCYHHSHIHCHS